MQLTTPGGYGVSCLRLMLRVTEMARSCICGSLAVRVCWKHSKPLSVFPASWWQVIIQSLYILIIIDRYIIWSITTCQILVFQPAEPSDFCLGSASAFMNACAFLGRSELPCFRFDWQFKIAISYKAFFFGVSLRVIESIVKSRLQLWLGQIKSSAGTMDRGKKHCMTAWVALTCGRYFTYFTCLSCLTFPRAGLQFST